MATQKPISTISYNSLSFLKEKLDIWYKAHIIQAYMFIQHKGEDGDKDHIHLYLEPNKKLDPMNLSDELREYVLDNPKPLGVRTWRPSKEEDWILYAVHDDDYLKIKYGGFERGEKLPYEWSDIVCSEDYDVQIAYIRAKSKLEHTSPNLAKRIQGGENPLKLVQQGENPFMVNTLSRMVYTSDYERLKRDYDLLIDAVERLGYVVSFTTSGEPCLFRPDSVTGELDDADLDFI